jgi:hypothetical protein
VQGGRVVELDLCSNDVVGALPGELGELTALVALVLPNTGITSKYVELFLSYCSSLTSERESY